ncbi:MAG TPA: CBS domain-containing protein [Nitrososphaera sp.]|nr:CBS domain-containing protein [Nitrososphaera sp.]
MYIVGMEARRSMRNAIMLGPEMTALDARNTMLRYGISRVVVGRKKKALGIVTEKDVARFMYEQVPMRELAETRLDEIMSQRLVTVPGETDVRECARLMLSKGISSLVVVDGSKNLEGIITKTDLVTAYVEHYSMEHKVHEFMKSKVVTVVPTEPIHSAIMLMRGNEISRVVVTEKDRVVGIVTGRDLLPLGGLMIGRFGRQSKAARPFIPSGVKEFMLVSDVMTPNPITTDPNADLADAAYIMMRNRISGLPVVGNRKSLKGLVTKTDVVRALSKHK